MSAPDWTRAACLDAPPNLFYPDHGGDWAYADARAICQACPIITECLDDVMAAEGSAAAGYRHGMRGGLTPTERSTRYRAAPPRRVVAVEAHCQDQRARVATLTTQGRSAAQIADALGISARTVVRYRTHLRAAVA